MLTQEENQFLTQVGPGTPGGTLFRRYWVPVATHVDISHENPTKFVRVLGEDLVLFMDKTGRVGLIADKCPHRSASLVYGRVEERGISCAYHGWLMDCDGNIIETPPERNDAIMKNVKTTAYPVQRFVGLYWAYLGPQPAPVIPHYDVWVSKLGTRKVFVQPQLDCNWVQPMENSVDPAHLQVLHQEFAGGAGRVPESTTRGFTDDVEMFEFYVNDYGIMKKRTYKNGFSDQHPLIFPNILRQGNSTQIRVPIDDEHTRVFFVRFFASDGSEVEEDPDLPVEFIAPYKEPADNLHPYTHFTVHHVQPQDHMAWETQGPIADRTKENLSFSDRGVALYRKVLKENIEKAVRGEDPFGLQRDPDHAMIDTNLMESIQWQTSTQAGGRAPGATR